MFFVGWKAKIEEHTPRNGCINMVIKVTTKRRRILFKYSLSRLPPKCVCGTRSDVQHVLSCKKGGFITLRHDHIRNVTTELLKSSDQGCENWASTAVSNWWNLWTTNSKRTCDARLDISAKGVLDQIPSGILRRKGLWSKRQEV